MDTELLVATRSADKLVEIRAILGTRMQARLITLTEAAVPLSPNEDAIEQHSTFIENAVAKARYFADLTGLPVLADDSGLWVDALGGRPGVRTKRFAIDEGFVAASVSGKALDAANNQLLLEKLRSVPDERRGAHYVCAAAFAPPHGSVITALGTCSGTIAHEERGNGGFGYDPLFFIPALNVTFAQLTSREKHERSHRARAFRALASHLH